MSRLTDQQARQGEGIAADPLPPSTLQGDPSESEVWDHDDTPPGVDPHTGEDHRSDEQRTAWAALESQYGEDIPYDAIKAWEGLT